MRASATFPVMPDLIPTFRWLIGRNTAPEQEFGRFPLPTLASAGEKVFRRILLNASGHHIPAGFQKSYHPGLCREVRSLMDEHDRLRVADCDDPQISVIQRRIDAANREVACSAWEK